MFKETFRGMLHELCYALQHSGIIPGAPQETLCSVGDQTDLSCAHYLHLRPGALSKKKYKRATIKDTEDVSYM